jgi:chemotaxis protein MotB
VTLEGHTDAFKTAPDAPTNWDISSARASAALGALEHAGIASKRFKGVTGLAATRPLLPNQPHAAVNRRISIVLELSD